MSSGKPTEPPPRPSQNALPPLRALRERRGISQQRLAELAGITRQSLYAVEQGKAQPSVAVALRIARALGATVEQLFEEGSSSIVEAQAAGSAVLPGTRVLLSWNGERRIALPLDPRSPLDAHRASDGTVRKRRGNRVKVELIAAGEVPTQTLVVAGCAPALSVIAERLSVPGSRVVSLQAASLPALELLRRDHVQVAGIHLVDGGTGQGNAPFIHRLLPHRHVLLFNLAVWEQGFVVAPGNPKGLRSGADLLRRGVRVVQREQGAAAQLLLEAMLEQAGASVATLKTTGLVAEGHLEVARFVASGPADVGVATRAAALAHGTDFVPLTEERFDLAIPERVARLDTAARFIDALRGPTVRRELESLGGYGTARTGELIAELKP